ESSPDFKNYSADIQFTTSVSSPTATNLVGAYSSVRLDDEDKSEGIPATVRSSGGAVASVNTGNPLVSVAQSTAQLDIQIEITGPPVPYTLNTNLSAQLGGTGVVCSPSLDFEFASESVHMVPDASEPFIAQKAKKTGTLP